MIAIFSVAAIIGVFLAGHYFAIHTTGAVILLGLCVVALGVLVAAMELRALEGQRIANMPLPWTWEKLWLQVMRLSEDRKAMPSAELLYVMTPEGIVPVTGLTTARINSERAFIFDITEEPSHGEVIEQPVF